MGELVGHDGAPFPRRERQPVSQPPAPGSVPFAGDIYQRRQGVNCSSLGTCCNRRRARSIISRDLVISSPSVFIRSSQHSKAPSGGWCNCRPACCPPPSRKRFSSAYHPAIPRWSGYRRRPQTLTKASIRVNMLILDECFSGGLITVGVPWPCDAMYLSCL